MHFHQTSSSLFFLHHTEQTYVRVVRGRVGVVHASIVVLVKRRASSIARREGPGFTDSCCRSVYGECWRCG